VIIGPAHLVDRPGQVLLPRLRIRQCRPHEPAYGLVYLLPLDPLAHHGAPFGSHRHDNGIDNTRNRGPQTGRVARVSDIPAAPGIVGESPILAAPSKTPRQEP
jgi:hypothetical protein